MIAEDTETTELYTKNYMQLSGLGTFFCFFLTNQSGTARFNLFAFNLKRIAHADAAWHTMAFPIRLRNRAENRSISEKGITF